MIPYGLFLLCFATGAFGDLSAASLDERIDALHDAVAGQERCYEAGDLDAIESAAHDVANSRETLLAAVEKGTRKDRPDSSLATALRLLLMTDGEPPRLSKPTHLRPFLDSPARRIAAVLAFESGDAEGALALVAGDRTEWAVLIRGASNRALGRDDAARLSFRRAMKSSSRLVSHIAFEAALDGSLGVTHAGRDVVIRLIKDLPLRRWERSRARRELARLLEAHRDSVAAAREWRSVLRSADTGEDLAASWNGLVRMTTFPTRHDTLTAWGAELRAEPTRLGEIADRLLNGQFNEAVSDTLRKDVANRLRKRRDFTRARDLLLPIAGAPDPVRRASGQLALARIERSSGEWIRMVSAYGAAMGDSLLRGTALFELAWEHHVGDSLESARRLYALAADEKANAFECAFRSGIAAFQLGAIDVARGDFARAGTVARKNGSRERALFWAERGRTETGDTFADSARDESVRERDRGPYGYIARAVCSGLLPDLGAIGSPGVPDAGSRGSAGTLESTVAGGGRDRFLEAALAGRLGYRRAAVRELRRVIHRHRKDKNEVAQVGFGALALGYPEVALRAGFRLPAAEPRAQRLRHPPAYLIEIQRGLDSAGSKLDPLLIMSLMRRESLFNPEARSAADALGLMQLLAQTAIEEARDAPGARVDTLLIDRALFEPAINLRLGLRHFVGLEREEGFLKAVAAYNAGMEAVYGWGEPEPDPWLWIETIPYRETRGYLRAVIGGYLTYRHLYRSSIDDDPGTW